MLPDGVSEISESDYFLKNDEFQVWLKEEKGKVCLIPPNSLLSETHMARQLWSDSSTLMNCPGTGLGSEFHQLSHGSCSMLTGK